MMSLVACVSLMSLAITGPVGGLRRKSAKANITAEKDSNMPIRPTDYYGNCGDCKWFKPECYKESCETYCNVMRSEPCVGKKAMCYAKGTYLGSCRCSKCPGRDLTRKELVQKFCDGKCAAGETCYHEGYAVVDGQVTDKVYRWWNHQRAMCAPCVLSYRRNPRTNHMCSACKADEAKDGCLSKEDE